MKCKNCGADNPEERLYCVSCGEPIERPEDDHAAVSSATPADAPDAEPECFHGDAEITGDSEEHGETAEDAPPTEDVAPDDAPAMPSAAAPKTRVNAATVFALALVVILILGAGLFFVLRNAGERQIAGEPVADAPADELPADGAEAPADGTEETPFVDPAPLPVNDAVIATSGDYSLDNEEFLFYYWDEFYYVYSQYSDYITYLMDPAKSFAAQEYQEGVTWRDYFTENALNTWTQTCALCDAANAAGYQLTAEERADLDATSEKLASYATQNGYATGEEYLRASYDDCVTEEGFKAYLESTTLASSYVSYAYQRFMDTYASLADQVKYNVQVRHILIEPAEATDAGKAAAKAEAERIYALWQEDPTEEHFAELAKEYSTDQGSKDNGGLYDDVTPGQMLATFNDWCFDAMRTVGDHGIVETDFGFHIMYFSGYSDTVYESAQQTAATNDYNDWLDPILSAAEYERTDAVIGYSR